MSIENTRLYGLDTLRALAISVVLMENYQVVAYHNIFGFMSPLGWVGVNLFFVLSGFLIGNQIFSAFAKGQDFSLKYFYIRRFLRTLPNYYVVFALYFLFPLIFGGASPAPLLSFLTFTQNLNMHSGSTFSHSWSLCVEEQFYLIFPLIALLLGSSKKSLVLGWCVIVAAMLVAISIRGYTWYKYGQASISGELLMQHIYYSSFTRFDGLLPGIAIAILKNFHPVSYIKIQKYGNFLLALGVLSTGVTMYVFHNYMYVSGYGFSLMVTSFGYSLLAISFGVLVLAALSPNSLLYRIRIPGAASLALWSYAIYLTHEPIFHLIKVPLIHFGININSPLATAIIFPVSIFCGWVLYKTVEVPFMNWRARNYPVNYKVAV